jgi:uncharacterized SAM-binding protein YcdF (DUF218 family)
VWILTKVVARLLFPLALCLEIMILGLILLWFTSRQKTGKVLVTLGVVLLAALGTGPVGDWVLGPLETSQPALEQAGDKGPIKWVVVLSGGFTPDPKIPVSGRPSPATLTRLVEGARLHQLLPGSKLVVSAENCGQADEVARTLTALASLLGVKPDALVLAEGAGSTAEEAVIMRRTVTNEPFLLVTSASHMPRALVIFQAQDMIPIPAPTDYIVRQRPASEPTQYIPSAENLRKSERAIYEYLGQAWAALAAR